MATPGAIEEKVLSWPAEKRIELAEKLMASVDNFATAEIETSWKAEIESRVHEIREGCAEGLPADEVMKKARKKLHETRRLSSAGRRRAR